MMMNPRFASTALTVLAAVVAPSPAISIQIAPHVVGPITEEVDYDPPGDIQLGPHVYDPPEEAEPNPYDIDTIQIEPHIYETEPPERPTYSGDECFEDLTYFSSQVLVDFDGIGSGAEEIRYDSLERIFRQAYNYLSAGLCDQTFRRIVDVSILPQPDGEMIILRGGNQYGIRFAVEAVCNGCDPDTTALFSPPAQDFFRKLVSSDGNAIQGIEESPLDQIFQKKRRLKSSKSKKKNSQKSSRNGDFFTCECTSADPKYRAPTEEEFASIYNSGIELFEEADAERRLETGVIVESVEGVTEIQSVTCTADTETITSLVALEFFGTFADISDQERTLIEDNYIFAYNGLQDVRCDSPAFRKMTGAEIFFVVDPDTNDEDTFVYLLKVEGSCRGEGCSDGGNAGFFSDGGTSVQRHLQTNDEELEFVDGPECTCPTWGTKFGPPSIKQMELRYFEVIQDLRMRELITSIDASGYVQEVSTEGVRGDTAAPSAAPISGVTLPPFTLPPTAEEGSSPPSAAPNASPVDTTAAPTDVPSSAPSKAAVPTEPPTPSPTATPTVSPTRPITPSPTRPETAAPTTPAVPTVPTDAPTATPVAPTVPTDAPTGTPVAPGDASEVPTVTPPLPGATPTDAPTVADTTSGSSSGTIDEAQ